MYIYRLLGTMLSEFQGWLKTTFCVFVDVLFVEEQQSEKLFITDATLGQDFFLLQETVYKKNENLN